MFHPAGRILASAGDCGDIRFWNARTGLPRRATPCYTKTKAVNGVAFSPDGRTLASAGTDGTVRLWRLRN